MLLFFYFSIFVWDLLLHWFHTSHKFDHHKRYVLLKAMWLNAICKRKSALWTKLPWISTHFPKILAVICFITVLSSCFTLARLLHHSQHHLPVSPPRPFFAPSLPSILNSLFCWQYLRLCFQWLYKHIQSIWRVRRGSSKDWSTTLHAGTLDSVPDKPPLPAPIPE